MRAGTVFFSLLYPQHLRQCLEGGIFIKLFSDEVSECNGKSVVIQPREQIELGSYAGI
jgi:hypothetical protein